MAAPPGALAPRQRRSERRFSAATLRWRLQSARTPHRAGLEPIGGRAKAAENVGMKYQRLVATTGPGRAAAVRQLHRRTPQQAHASERSSIRAGDGSTGPESGQSSVAKRPQIDENGARRSMKMAFRTHPRCEKQVLKIPLGTSFFLGGSSGAVRPLLKTAHC